jgi:hypothetical protein
MKSLMAQSLVWGAVFVAGFVAPTKPLRAANCALYARAETGVELYGAAGGWWDEAGGRYERGSVPALGSILVFKRTGQIPSGHVAVVAEIVGPHEILVDHANWYRGTVSRGMSVIDTSPNHDWTAVAVMNPPSGTHGRDYPTYGFVYPRPGPREIADIRDRRGFDADDAEGGIRPTLLHFAVAIDEWRGRVHTVDTTRRNHHPKETAARPVHKASSANPHNQPAARVKPASTAHESHASAPRAPAHLIRTTEVKHHRA